MDRLLGMSIFVTAVDTGSLAAAARRFRISPAMAGKHLGALESRLSARLLHRTTRRLGLTDAGRIYYERAKRILDDVDDADREAQALEHSPRGTLRIATPVTFGALHLGPVLARYLEAYPEVTLEVMASDRYVDLVEQGVDIAIRIGQLADSSLMALKLAPCRMIACAAPAFLARHGAPAKPADLRAMRRLAFSESVSPGDWTFVDARGRRHVIDTPSCLRGNDIQLLVAAACDGAGVVYGPTFVLGEHLAAGTLRRVLSNCPSPELAIHAVYPSSRQLSTKARNLLDRLLAELGDAPWDDGLMGSSRVRERGRWPRGR